MSAKGIEETRDLIEERAAIMEYLGGQPRHLAQNKAAKLHGFANWSDYENQTKERKDNVTTSSNH